MRICTFRLPNESLGLERLGIVQGSRIFEAKGRRTMTGYLLGGGSLEIEEEGFDMADVILKAPVARPGKIIAAIVNTQGMLGGKDIFLDRPRLDMKAPSAVIGPEETVAATELGIRPEVELAAIIGKKLTRADEAEATRSISGFTVLNDVTCPQDSRDDAYEAYRRDRRTGQITRTLMRGTLFRSKNHDTFCPLGPWMVTADEFSNISQLRMTTKFEGSVVQDGSTSEYLFTPARIASYASSFLTLEPGDIVSCGSVGWTPEALGDLDPTEYVLPKKDGVLELEIEGIGKLVNPVMTDT